MLSILLTLVLAVAANGQQGQQLSGGPWNVLEDGANIGTLSEQALGTWLDFSAAQGSGHTDSSWSWDQASGKYRQQPLADHPGQTVLHQGVLMQWAWM